MSRREEKKEEITAEGVLAADFGSDQTIISKGTVDIRRFSKIGPIDKFCLAYFLNVPDARGGRFWRTICGNFLNLACSEDGWKTNKAIQLVAGSKGAPSVGELQKKPGVLQRNITDRDWKKKAEEEGRTIVE